VGFQRVDDFQGKYLQKIYDQNHECDIDYKETEREVSKEFNAIFDPPLKNYAL
jgi:predicted HicB family RNase H-like nuclease